MADPHEPRRQHVQQQPPDELQRRQRHDPLPVAMGIVLVTEADHAVLEVEQAGIADRHAMRVPRQILQHLFGAAERPLGVDDPVGAERPLTTPARTGRTPRKRSRLWRTPHGGPPGTCRETPGSGPAPAGRSRRERPPSGSVRRQPAARHDAMDVRVELQILAPGVQHRQHAGLGTQVLGIGGHLEQGLGGGPQEQVVDDPRIGQCDRVEGIREREDEMEIRHREQFRGAGLQPPCRGRGLAGGAVAIAAGVVGDLLMPALGAPQDVTAQGRGAAGGQVVEGAALLGCQPRAVLFQELVETAPDDLGHGGPRSSHDRGPPRGQVEAIQRAPGRLQRRGGHMEVPSRGVEAAMAEQDLDGPQVGAGLEQVGREAVPQRLNTLLIHRLS